MMKLILAYFDRSNEALQSGVAVDTLVALPVRERVGRFKYVEPERMQEEYQSVLSQLDAEIAQAGEKEEF